MIKVNELRFGNLLLADIGTVKVESVLGSTYRVYAHSLDEEYLADYSIQHLQPIPLTEEWLLKAGFTKHDNPILPSYNMDIAWHPNEYKVLYVTIEQGNQYLGVRDGNKFQPREHDEIIIIRNADIHGGIFLHHIQNAYHLFTGKELTFNHE